MPGIPWEVAEHALETWSGSKLVKQRLCRFNEEKRGCWYKLTTA